MGGYVAWHFPSLSQMEGSTTTSERADCCSLARLPPVCQHLAVGTVLPRDQGPPPQSNGWVILPQAKEELPSLF